MVRVSEAIEIAVMLWQLIEHVHFAEGGPVIITIALLVAAVRTRSSTVAYAAAIAAMVIMVQG